MLPMLPMFPMLAIFPPSYHQFVSGSRDLFRDAPRLFYGGCGQPAVPLQDKSQQGMSGQAMMASVLEAWATNDDASPLPFDAKITRRYADDLGEVIEVTLLGEKTVLPIFRNERCPIILQILNFSMTNRNADQVGRILAREKHCVPILSAAGLLVQAAARGGCAICPRDAPSRIRPRTHKLSR